MQFALDFFTKSIVRLVAAVSVLALTCSISSSNPIPTHIEVTEVGSVRTFELSWATIPGETYQVWRSGDLNDWLPIEGQLRIADGPAMAFAEPMPAGKVFYQVTMVDTTAPEITGQYPKADGFAIGRFDDISMVLNDPSGIDPATVSLTVGSLGVFTLADPELSFANQLLTFDHGPDIALGAYGETINVSLTLADTLGHSTTYGWSFTLELETIVVENLFVFGSPNAQRAGQRVAATPTRALARRFASGPIRMNAGATEWGIAGVTETSVLISYTGSTPPTFAVGTYLTNLTPVSPEEFFYRQVTAVANDAVAGEVTLTTIDVELSDILLQGSIRMDDDALLVEQDSNGTYIAARALQARSESREKVYTLPSMHLSYPSLKASFGEGGFSVSGKRPNGSEISVNVGEPEPPLLELSLDEFEFSLDSSLEFSMEIDSTKELVKSSVISRGNLRTATLASVSVTLPHWVVSTDLLPVEIEFEKDILFTVGPVPVKIDFEIEPELEFNAQATSVMSVTAGLRTESEIEFGLQYNKPSLEWVNNFEFTKWEPVWDADFTLGEFSATLTPSIEVDILLYGQVGIEAEMPLEMGIKIETTTDAMYGGSVERPVLKGTLPVELKLNIGPELNKKGVLGWLLGDGFFKAIGLDEEPSLWFSASLWEKEWPLFPKEVPFAFLEQPSGGVVPEGKNFTLSAGVSLPDEASYQWFFGGQLMPGETNPVIKLTNLKNTHSGAYNLRATRGNETVWSDNAYVQINEKIPENSVLEELYRLGYFRANGLLVTNIKGFTIDATITNLRGLNLLTNLESLAIRGARFREIHDGELPKSLKSILVQRSPGVIDQIESIDLGDMPHLTYFSYSEESPLKSLIIGNAPVLEVCSIKMGSLENLTIGDAPSLRFLGDFVSFGVKIGGVKSISLGETSAIEEIYLRGNGASLVLGDLPDLKRISLNGVFDDITIGNMIAVDSLSLGVSARNISFGDLSSNVTNLNPLSAYENLETLETFAIGNAPALTHIGLGGGSTGYNGDGKLQSFSIGDVPNMTSLILSGNRLHTFNIGACQSLDILDLRRNCLSRISLSGADSLTRLILNENNLAEFSLVGSPLLKVINLSENQLKNLVLNEISMLEELSARFNEIAEIRLGDLTSVREIDLTGNRLSDIELPDALELKRLGVGYNELIEIKLGKMPLVETIHLSGNRLTSLALPETPVLKWLDLANNRLFEMSLDSMPLIQGINLNDNDLSSLLIPDSPMLSYLEAARNRLAEISLGELPMIERIKLMNNRLSSFSLGDAPNLKDLQIDTNYLTSFVLGDIPNAEYIGLESNLLGQALEGNLMDSIEIWQLNGTRVDYGPQMPKNALFATATQLLGFSGESQSTNKWSIHEPGEPNHGGVAAGVGAPHGSVWWKWSAPTNGSFTVSASGGTSVGSFNTVIAVYTGTEVESLTEIKSASNIDLAINTLEFEVEVGKVYYIAVSGRDDNVIHIDSTTTAYPGGSIDLFYRLSAENSNMRFEDAYILIGDTVRAIGSNIEAAGELGEPDHAGASFGEKNSVWWKWIAPEDGAATISTVGSDFDTVLAVYQGSAVDALTEVVANDDFNGSQSQVSFRASALETYYIAVDGYGSETGNIELSIDLEYGTPPSNDDFANAEQLLGNANQIAADYTFATAEAGEPSHADSSEPLTSLWWKWTADQDGLLTVAASSNPNRSVLAVYRGSSLDDLELVGAGSVWTSDVSLVVNDGEEYFIAVDGRGYELGAVSLIQSFKPASAPINDNFADALVFDFENYDTWYELDTYFSTSEPGEPVHGENTEPIGSVWYRVTTTSTGYMEIDSSTNFDRALAVYTGDQVNDLTRLEAQNDSPSAQADSLGIMTAPGTTYHIAVDGTGVEDGTGSVYVTMHETSGDDDFGQYVLEPYWYGLLVHVSSTTTGQANEPAHGSDTGSQNSVWWSWAAPYTGTFELADADSDAGLILAVYTGTELTSLEEVASSSYTVNGAGDPVRPSLSFDVVKGVTYHFVAESIGNSELNCVISQGYLNIGRD